jgi:hypothetical protein
MTLTPKCIKRKEEQTENDGAKENKKLQLV